MRYTLPIPVLAIAFMLSGQSLAAAAALGKTASVQGEVHRYGIPRSDLQVTVDGVTIKPALAARRLARLRPKSWSRREACPSSGN